MELNKIVSESEREAVLKMKAALEAQHVQLLERIDRVNTILSNGCTINLSK